MDSKAYRLSILAIITTVVLVGVVVYAANRERIAALIGADEFGSSVEEEIAEDEDIDESDIISSGEQIGDDLKGFLKSDNFFDKSEQRPSVVVVVDNIPVPANSEDGLSNRTTDVYDPMNNEVTGDDRIEASPEDITRDRPTSSESDAVDETTEDVTDEAAEESN
ncbi:hypothetical protein [Butyrivibrio sp. WCD3002]|jgi:hypothetical protein|uniref:hypothetical protein n=1 Tax=Butyrivibrio sp. WCD3002 TaxID=1280676 RepID=UPI0003F4FD89|nr:hypothetical protein [Butyrivibrio sp. WCD3002]